MPSYHVQIYYDLVGTTFYFDIYALNYARDSIQLLNSRKEMRIVTAVSIAWNSCQVRKSELAVHLHSPITGQSYSYEQLTLVTSQM